MRLSHTISTGHDGVSTNFTLNSTGIPTETYVIASHRQSRLISHLSWPNHKRMETQTTTRLLNNLTAVSRDHSITTSTHITAQKQSTPPLLRSTQSKKPHSTRPLQYETWLPGATLCLPRAVAKRNAKWPASLSELGSLSSFRLSYVQTPHCFLIPIL